MSPEQLQARDLRDTLGKVFDEKEGVIRFRSGPIDGRPGYALTKHGSLIRTTPRILNKKERRRNTKAIAEHEHGYSFRCSCNGVTYHYLSHHNIHIEGYEKAQRQETYECSVCHAHFDKEKIDEVVRKVAAEIEAKNDPGHINHEPHEDPR